MVKNGRPKRVDVRVSRRQRKPANRPILSWQDVLLCFQLPILLTVAWLTPERIWYRICKRLHALSMRSASEFEICHSAYRTEHYLQILRSHRPGGWTPAVELDGRSHVDAALADHRGVVLWFGHFVFSSLITKQALAAAGYRIFQLRRPEHGFSSSEIGTRFLNPVRTRIEERFAGRIIIDRNKPAFATHAVQCVLRKGGIVAITAGAFEGTRIMNVPVGGGYMKLATGAPSLAFLTQSTLLPVFTVRDSRRGHLVVIESKIELTGDTIDVVALNAGEAYAQRLDAWISKYPEQWRDWKNVRKGM
jgi:lauroyl/myristoyl acyltransferase